MTIIADRVESYIAPPLIIKIRLKSNTTRRLELQCIRPHLISIQAWNRHHKRYVQRGSTLTEYIVNIKSDIVTGEFHINLGTRMHDLIALVFDIELRYSNDSMRNKIFEVYNEKNNRYIDMSALGLIRLIDFTFHSSAIDKPTMKNVIIATKEMVLKDNDLIREQSTSSATIHP